MIYPYTMADDEGPGYPVETRDTITDLPPPGCHETMIPPAPITVIPTGDDD